MACKKGWYELVKYLTSNYRNIELNIKNMFGETALYCAVMDERINCTRLLLSHPNIDVTIPCGEFDKPVLWYCKSRECYNLLSRYYTTINEYKKKLAWLCSLMLSYQTVDVQEVKDLMETIPREALLQMKDDVSMMMLIAADRGKAEILEYLLSSYGDIIDINIQDKRGETALTRAVRRWQADCVKLLLAFPNINLTVLNKSLISKALSRSVADNNVEVLKALLDHPKIDVNEMFNSQLMEGTLLCFAVVGGLIDCVKLLLSRRDIDVTIPCEEFDKPVLWYCGNRECYDLLLPHYRTLNEYEKKMAWLYSLCLCGKGVVEEVKKLIDDFPVNDFGQMKDDVSVLIMSLIVRKDKGEIIKYILSSCHSIIDINFQNKDGNTLLYQAVRYKELEVVRFLLAQPNINVNVQAGEFDKPVLWYCSNRECYDLLLPHYPTLNKYEKKMAWLWSLLCTEKGVVKEVEDIMETIPREVLLQIKDDVSVMVMLAAEKGKAEILEYLVSSYGDIIEINRQDKYGRSSLHRAILNRQRHCEDILLRYKIDKTLRDKDEKTANDLKRETSKKKKKEMNMFHNITNQLRVKFKVKWMNKHDFAQNDTMKTEDSQFFPLMELNESMSQYERYFQTLPSYFKTNDDRNDLEYDKREYNRSFKLFRRRNTSPEKVDQMEQAMVIREGMMKIADVRSELNDQDVLMCFEENDLEDFIILDPIEHLVKPATSTIDKYLTTRGHLSKMIHEIPEIHEEGKNEYDEDRMKMMEFGRLSELALNDLWAQYYPHLSDTGVAIQSNNSIDNDLLMMIRFGLLFLPPITSLDNSGNSNSNNVYYIPSLLPSDSPSGSGGGSNDGSENGGDDSKDSKEQKFRAKFNAKNEMPDESWNVGMHYSVFFYLLMDDYPLHKSPCLVCDIISSSELTNNGSLPPGFFERFIDHFKQRLSGFQLNEMINCVRGKATLTFSFLEISFIESREEKRIEVIFRTHPDADKMKAKIVFQDIYYIIIDVIDGIRKQSNIGGLQVKTLVHPPPEKTASCDFICINATGFITLTTVRQLLSKLTIPDGSSNYKQTSCDSSFKIELNLLTMRRDSYWSVWEEKRSILPLVAGSCSAVPSLPARKETHIFLSYDWGIDGNNHNRVKQVSEALKSRGLITWIDDERIVNEIDERIIDGIDHTECMVVFMTENYAQKLQGRNDKDYCKKEFKYGFEVLGREKMILVVLDEPMRDLSRWPSLVKFHLSSILYFDLSEIFKPSSNTSEDFVKEKMSELFKKITTVLQLEHNQTLDSCTTSKKKKRKLTTLSSNRVEVDNDQGVLSSDNNLNREKKKKKRKIDDELSSDENELDRVVSEDYFSE